jgi:acyl transferase domain-containing protein
MKPQIKIMNSTTGEEVVREMNDEEYLDYQQWQTQVATEQAQAEAKEEAKASAYSKLEALGLSADDIEALGLVKPVIKPTELTENL